MAKSKKKSSSATKSAVRKPRPAHKAQAKKVQSKNSAPEKKIARRLPKTNLERTESPAALLLGLNHREKKLDPFVRKQKQKLLQLRDAVVDSMQKVREKAKKFNLPVILPMIGGGLGGGDVKRLTAIFQAVFHDVDATLYVQD